MSFRTKLFLLFLLTVLASVTLVAWGVTRYTRKAFEELDTQRTEALVAQFHKEFAQRAEDVAHRPSPMPTLPLTCMTPTARPRSRTSITWSSSIPTER
jgi:hypothetical protein